MDKIESRLVDAKTLKSLLGFENVRRIQQLTQDGVIDTIEVDNGGRKVRRYDLWPTAKKYISYLQDKAAGRDIKKAAASKNEEKLQAEIDYKRAKARIAELELDEIEGRMHRAEDVESMTADLCLAIRSALLALPGRLATDMAEIDDPSLIATRVKEEVTDILEELSNYRYDEKKYRERVQERRGNESQNEEEDEEE